MAVNKRVPYCHLRRIRARREQKEAETFMHAMAQAYLTRILNDPATAQILQDNISFAYPEAHPSMLRFRIGGFDWIVQFSQSHKHPNLKSAKLDHPQLDVVVREQNPLATTPMAQWKREGHEVFQIFVDGQPVVGICNGEFFSLTPVSMRKSS